VSDSSVVLNPGTGGDSLDAELIGSLKRERHQIGGAALAEIVRVKNTIAAYTDYGAVVRVAPVRNVAGAYFFSGALVSVAAAAQNGTSTGALWLQVPVGNAKNARLRYLLIQVTYGATLIDVLSVPLIAFTRFTFTGTASGAQLTVGKRKSTDAANTATARTAVTGMTVSLAGELGHVQVPAAEIVGTTSSGGFSLVRDFLFAPKSEDDFADLGAGEGVVIYQVTAGTTSDVRRFTVQGIFDEYTP